MTINLNKRGKTAFLGYLFFTLISTGFFAGKVKAKDQMSRLKCDKSNYREYVRNIKKTRKLIRETGKGCQLVGANFLRANLEGANLSEGANLILKGRISKGRISDAKIQTWANLERGISRGQKKRKISIRRNSNRGGGSQRANLSRADLRGR